MPGGKLELRGHKPIQVHCPGIGHLCWGADRSETSFATAAGKRAVCVPGLSSVYRDCRDDSHPLEAEANARSAQPRVRMPYTPAAGQNYSDNSSEVGGI